MPLASSLDSAEAALGAVVLVIGWVAVIALWWFMVGAPGRRERRAARSAAGEAPRPQEHDQHDDQPVDA